MPLLETLSNRVSGEQPKQQQQQQLQQHQQQQQTLASLSPQQLQLATHARLRVATMLFRAFLHNLDTLATLADFNVFWLKFVGSMERCMKVCVSFVSFYRISSTVNSIVDRLSISWLNKKKTLQGPPWSGRRQEQRR